MIILLLASGLIAKGKRLKIGSKRLLLGKNTILAQQEITLKSGKPDVKPDWLEDYVKRTRKEKLNYAYRKAIKTRN